MGCLVTDEVVIPCTVEHEEVASRSKTGIAVGEWLDSLDDEHDQAYLEVQGIEFTVGAYLDRWALDRLIILLSGVRRSLFGE